MNDARRASFGFLVALLGFLVVLFGVIAVLSGLAIAGCEPFHALSGRLSTLILGAVPLVYARGRNAAIGTVLCSALMLVVFIVVCFPQGANGIDIQIPGQPRSLLFEPQRYDI